MDDIAGLVVATVVILGGGAYGLVDADLFATPPPPSDGEPPEGPPDDDRSPDLPPDLDTRDVTGTTPPGEADGTRRSTAAS